MKESINIEMSTSVRRNSARDLNLTIKSQDIHNSMFLLNFRDGKGDPIELGDGFTVEVLSVFKESKSEALTEATIYGNYAHWEFDTRFIHGKDTVFNYVYVKKDGVPVVSADANAFYFAVDLSKIDEGAERVAEYYDKNYERVLHDFEVSIDMTKEEWAQMADETRNFVDGIKDVTVEQFVETKMGEELANLEVNYATRLTGLESNDASLAAQLARTMTQTEFDSWVATLLDGGPSIFMDTLAALQATYPSGSAGVALVRETDPARIYVWDGDAWKDFGEYQGLEVKSESISPDKTTFFDISKNLWNESTAKRNVSVNTSGEIISEEGRMLGDFIPVTPGEIISYDGSYIRNIYYTKNKQFISRVGIGVTPHFTVPSLTNIGYVRFSPPELIATSFMANRGSVLLPHEKGYIKLKQELLPESDSVNELQVLNIVSSKLLPLERDISKVTTKENMLKVESDGDFTFFLKIAEGEYAAHRFKRDAVEDFIKKYEESIYTKEKSTTLANYDWQNESDMIGTAPGQITNNQYTATVGKKINFNFDGNQITMRYPSRYDGGMWRATIDGVFVKNISTRSTATSIVTREEIIATGLESGLHTLTIEFMGNDPSNPATTVDLVTPTTPRGWISADASTPDDARKTFKVVKISENITKRFDLTSGFSNKEFAFEVEKVKDEGSQWFPAHFGIGTTNRGAIGLQYLIVDGEEISITKSSGGYIRFEKAEFVQVMECKRTDDTEVRAIIKLIMSVDGSRIKQQTEIEFLQNTHVRNAYVFMIPALNSYLAQIKSNSAERVYADIVNLGTSEYFDASATHFTATSDAVDMSDYYLTLGITHLSKPLDSTYLQHRSDGTLQKLYPKTLSQYQAVAGEILQYDGFWEVGKTKGANRVYG